MGSLSWPLSPSHFADTFCSLKLTLWGISFRAVHSCELNRLHRPRLACKSWHTRCCAPSPLRLTHISLRVKTTAGNSWTVLQINRRKTITFWKGEFAKVRYFLPLFVGRSVQSLFQRGSVQPGTMKEKAEGSGLSRRKSDLRQRAWPLCKWHWAKNLLGSTLIVNVLTHVHASCSHTCREVL